MFDKAAEAEYHNGYAQPQRVLFQNGGNDKGCPFHQYVYNKVRFDGQWSAIILFSFAADLIQPFGIAARPVIFFCLEEKEGGKGQPQEGLYAAHEAGIEQNSLNNYEGNDGANVEPSGFQKLKHNIGVG
jgi:hypothetical protein